MSRNEDKRSDVDQVERIVPFMRQKMSFMLSKKKNRRGRMKFKLKSQFFGKNLFNLTIRLVLYRHPAFVKFPFGERRPLSRSQNKC